MSIFTWPAKTDDLWFCWQQLPSHLQTPPALSVYPDPAKNSFTTSGLSYLKSARTVTLEIPIVTGKKQQALTNQPITMYSLSFVLKRIAEEVVNRRVRTISYSVEDYETGFPIVGASVTITPASSILSVDSLLAAYISQPNLRDVASKHADPLVIQSETQIQKPQGSLSFSVMFLRRDSKYCIDFS